MFASLAQVAISNSSNYKTFNVSWTIDRNLVTTPKHEYHGLKGVFQEETGCPCGWLGVEGSEETIMDFVHKKMDCRGQKQNVLWKKFRTSVD